MTGQHPSSGQLLLFKNGKWDVNERRAAEEMGAGASWLKGAEVELLRCIWEQEGS